MHYRETQCGFEFGAATVTRLCSDEEEGWVEISIRTPKSNVQVYVTKTGKVRVYLDNEELKPKEKQK